MPLECPAGVSLVFTEIEGSSELWERHGAGFKAALDRHHQVLWEVAARWSGFELWTEGASFFFAFARAANAVRFAPEAQLGLAEVDWPALLTGLPAISVHTGEPVQTRDSEGRFTIRVRAW